MSDNIFNNDNDNLEQKQEELNVPVPCNNNDFIETDNTKISKSRERIVRRRKNRRIKAIVRVVITVVIAITLAFSFLAFMSDYMGIHFEKARECVVEIEEGLGTKAIANVLKKEGVINNTFFFRIFCKLGGYDGSFKYGVYTLSNELSYKNIANRLQEDGEVDNYVEVTIPERSNIDDIMRILEEKGVCNKADFRAAMKNGNYSDISFVDDIPEEMVYYRFEGYLFPDTYQFYNYDSAECAELAIRKMLKRTEEVLTKDLIDQMQADHKTLHDVLTMASIVELEASASLDEMPKVAAVFYNRLVWDEPQRLGSSPTAEYPYGEGRYDTNKIEGLPVGPLCSPSLAAIKASIYPAKNFPYTYFVTDSEMKFYYNETFRQHNQTIALLKSQGKWLG